MASLTDLEKSLWRENCHHVANTYTRIFNFLSHTHAHTHTYTLRQLTVSSPLCHIKDAATLWASDDTQIQTHRYTHTLRSTVSHLPRGWGAVWEGYPTCFSAYCMCESVSVSVYVHVSVFVRPASSWGTCHSLYQSEENMRDTHLHMCTHQIQTVSKRCHF